MFITVLVDANVGRNVDIFDIQEEYLHNETYEGDIILLEVPLADLMVKVAPKIYCKCVIITSKGKPLLCVHIQKSLYGLLQSSLLFYRKMMKDLGSYIFQLKPYIQ